jgi:hypothetical protein
MFRGVHMENLEGMTLKMLQPHNEDTKRMIGWIEDDVYTALEKGYLYRLHFCVSSNSQGTDLIEQYTYKFTYTDEGMLRSQKQWP